MDMTWNRSSRCLNAIRMQPIKQSFGRNEQLYGRLIPQYQRERKDKNLDLDTLWNYYRYQAMTLMALEKTVPALEQH